MTAPREIMIHRLIAMGADGLYNPHAECGCELSDLAPCQCLNLDDCLPALAVDGGFTLLWKCMPYCPWEAYQADPSYENCCRWLKHKAWMKIEGCQ